MQAWLGYKCSAYQSEVGFTVAIDKEQREYMNWLKDIKKFVAK